MTQRIALANISVFANNVSNVLYTYEGTEVPAPMGDGCGHYQGMLTSVAPMECLIDLAQSEGMPIAKIVYLCSKDARTGEKELPDGECLTPERYFRKAICEYYLSAGDRLSCGPADCDDDNYFVAIPYDESDPTGSLQAIVESIGAGKVLVDVETTGGPRDAAVLTTIAIQVIKARYSLPAANSEDSRVGLGNTVYASKTWGEDVGNITRQNRTYDLVDLTNALEAFTRYGKAQPLLEFFEQDDGGRKSSKELMALLKSMQDFSDALALCNVKDVSLSIMNMYYRLDSVRKHHERVKPEATRRAELLFTTLLEGLEEDFVKDVGTHPTPRECAGQTIAIIRWCVSRQFLQQALSLVYELYPTCMEQLGYIDWGSEPLLNTNSRQSHSLSDIQRVEQLILYYTTKEGDPTAINKNALRDCVDEFSQGSLRGMWSKDKERVCAALLPARVANETYIRIVPEAARIVPSMLIWYQMIIYLRNEIMHADHESNKRRRQNYYRACKTVVSNDEEFRCQYDAESTPANLSKDILKAIDALEGKIVLKSPLFEPPRMASRSSTPRVKPQSPPKPKTDNEVPEPVSPKASAITPQFVIDIARGNGESLVLWSDLYSSVDEEPKEVRSATRKRKKAYIEELVQYLNRAAENSWRFAVVDTIVVRNDEIYQPSAEGNQGCARARDFLLHEVPRERQGVIADDAARSKDRSNSILTRNAVGIKKNNKTQTVFSYLSTRYPETFECGNPAIRVKGM